MVILTVEDEYLISEYLRSILEGGGHRVIATFDADEAIGVLEKVPGIELVITDINMPGLAEAHSPKTKSRRCCETMIFVLSSFIRLSEPTSRGTVTGQRNSRTRLRVLAPRAEHPNTQARARRDVMLDVRMFTTGWPHREGGLFAGLRTY